MFIHIICIYACIHYIYIYRHWRVPVMVWRDRFCASCVCCARVGCMYVVCAMVVCVVCVVRVCVVCVRCECVCVCVCVREFVRFLYARACVCWCVCVFGVCSVCVCVCVCVCTLYAHVYVCACVTGEIQSSYVLIHFHLKNVTYYHYSAVVHPVLTARPSHPRARAWMCPKSSAYT